MCWLLWKLNMVNLRVKFIEGIISNYDRYLENRVFYHHILAYHI